MFDSVGCQMGIRAAVTVLFSGCGIWSGVDWSSLLQHRQQRKVVFSTAAHGVEKSGLLYCLYSSGVEWPSLLLMQQWSRQLFYILHGDSDVFDRHQMLAGDRSG